MTVIIIIVLLLAALLLLQRSRREQGSGPISGPTAIKAKNLRRTGLVLAVIALVIAIVDAAEMALDDSGDEVPTLTGDRLP